MEPSGTRAETEHEPVAANPFGGTPPWQRGGGWKRGLAGVGALILTVGSIVGVSWLAFRDTGVEDSVAGDVIFERCTVTEADDAEPTVDAPRLGTPADRTIATIETSHGSLDVMLWGDVAPCGVEAFLHLAGAGYYSNHDCDRLTTQEVMPTAILHCGSPGAEPEATESFGPGWRYQTEVGMEGVDVQDVLALVTDESGRAGSAFTLIRGEAVPTAGVSIIGGIIDGYEVLDAIAALPDTIAYDGAPPQPVTVYGITILEESDLPTGDNGAPETGGQTPTTPATETPSTELSPPATSEN
ncbi:peptidylprolyl isomerase [Glycomyces sp. L485]|uniref:peptidylprolyl isomerase n=1 Tax=Glycomyces sp. L485 TaxID=2909235 RepID=UPI001F4A3489|nr:peptidylprolyl isomerase [Glycomyces sp. L485]MCH7229698.1 peptidylprolyl isomerase [Glycomyces sp. L485]